MDIAKVVTDNGYKKNHQCLGLTDVVDWEKAAHALLKAMQETFNSRLKNFKILRNAFWHSVQLYKHGLYTLAKLFTLMVGNESLQYFLCELFHRCTLQTPLFQVFYQNFIMMTCFVVDSNGIRHKIYIKKVMLLNVFSFVDSTLIKFKEKLFVNKRKLLKTIFVGESIWTHGELSVSYIILHILLHAIVRKVAAISQYETF